MTNFSLAGFNTTACGLGPSASSRFFREGVFHHRKQLSNWERYLQSSSFLPPTFESTNAFQTVLEATFLELRKRSGIDTALFQQRYGYALRSAKAYPIFLEEGFLEEREERVFLTSKGWLLAEGIAEKLVDESLFQKRERS